MFTTYRVSDEQADAILVHHGYFWKGESQPITGMKKRRIGALLANDINLFAYHLPLDIHPELLYRSVRLHDGLLQKNQYFVPENYE